MALFKINKFINEKQGKNRKKLIYIECFKYSFINLKLISHVNKLIDLFRKG